MSHNSTFLPPRTPFSQYSQFAAFPNFLLPVPWQWNALGFIIVFADLLFRKEPCFQHLKFQLNMLLCCELAYSLLTMLRQSHSLSLHFSLFYFWMNSLSFQQHLHRWDEQCQIKNRWYHRESQRKRAQFLCMGKSQPGIKQEYGENNEVMKLSSLSFSQCRNQTQAQDLREAGRSKC